MSGQTVWFEYEDEEAELRDIPMFSSVSTLRRKLHEGKIFHFPDSATQTDVQIGRLNSAKQFEKFKARDTLDSVKYGPEETLQVRVKKRAGMHLSHYIIFYIFSHSQHHISVYIY